MEQRAFPYGGPALPEEQAAQQLLRYASELHRLHSVQQSTQQELDAAHQAMREGHEQQLAIIEDLKRIYESERAAREQLREAYLSTVKVLAAAIEAKDDFTGAHVDRVRRYSVTLARELDLPEETGQGLDVGAILHDIGKVGIPDAILAKPGSLNDDEWRQMRQHPGIGCQLLQNVPFLIPALDVVANHHERWDGTGYPLGLRGEAIPLPGRIVAVADAFDALTTDRVYRGRRTTGAAVDEIERCAGSHFDPEVVAAFKRAFMANRL